MNSGEIASAIADQFVTVWSAPIPFLAAILFAGWLIWIYVKREYATRLANAQSTIDLLDRRLQTHQVDETIAIAAATADSALPKRRSTAKTLTVTTNASTTAKEIFETFRQHTAVRANELVQPLIGSVMEVAGTVAQVNLGDEGYVVSVSADDKAGLVFCVFPESHPDIGEIDKDDAITVKGKISTLSTLWINLIDCQIISAS